MFVTEPEFKKIFDSDFKLFKRYLKEKGVYKFITHYMFSHDNKKVDDLYNSIVDSIKEPHDPYNEFQGGVRGMLRNVKWIGYTKTPFNEGDLIFWQSYVSKISEELLNDSSISFSTDKYIFYIVNGNNRIN